MAGVSFQHPDYEAGIADWKMVSTLCAGDSAVKASGKTLLPDPVVVSGETKQELNNIYERYKQRAMFANVVGKTRSSLVGSVFRKAPRLETPPTVSYVAADVDGAGISVYQQSQSVLSELLATGRGGLLVDYPATDVAASVADMAAGLVRANIVAYRAEDVVNWQHQRVGGKSVLALVVLSEMATESDGYGQVYVQQLRALRLVEGLYVVELWRKDSSGEWQLFAMFEPRMASGARWTVIPFTFVGAVNNDANVDTAPLFDLAVVNRKHYQLGADWYNALYFSGQPQPVIAGLTVEWRDYLEANGIVVGSRAPFLLNEGASFTYATVPADQAIQRELDTLMSQMVALGARLTMPGEAAKTATQSVGEQEVGHSVISLAAENVSDAYTQALRWVLDFMGGTGEVEYRLNNDLSVIPFDAAMVQAITAAWQSGTMPKSDAIRFLQRVGLIDGEKSAEEIADEIDASAGGLNLDG